MPSIEEIRAMPRRDRRRYARLVGMVRGVQDAPIVISYQEDQKLKVEKPWALTTLTGLKK